MSDFTDRDRAEVALITAGLDPNDYLSIETEAQAREYLASEEMRKEMERKVRRERDLEQELRAHNRSPLRRAEQHEDADRNIEAIRRKLAASREGTVGVAGAQVRGREGQKMPADEWTTFRSRVSSFGAQKKLDEQLAKEQREHRKAAKDIRVTHEPGAYEKGSPHSWVRDVLALRGQQVQSTAGSVMTQDAVRERLSRHGNDVRTAMLRGSKYGQRAEAIVHEVHRCESEENHQRKVKEARRELRAFGTDGGISATSPGEAASFVPPAIVEKAFSVYRTPFASLASQCKAEDLPSWGLNVYVPHISSPTEVTSQTEGSAVAEKTPATVLIKSTVVNKSGQVKTSQQFLDRAGPGIAGDKVLFEQLRHEIDTETDGFVISQALAEAQSVTNSTATFSFAEKEGVGGFLGDIRKGKNLVASAAGTRVKASHLFAPSKFTNYIEATAMSTGGPNFSPAWDGSGKAVRFEGDPYGEGWSGFTLSQLGVWSDENLPQAGTTANYQVVITEPKTILLFRSAPVFSVFPETYANTLDAAVIARQYVACVPRWPEAVVTLSGAFYKASLFA